MDALGLEGRTVVVTGLANRRSVAAWVGRRLEEVGATPVYVVHTPERAAAVVGLAAGRAVHVCDVTRPAEVERLAGELGRASPSIDGLVHSVAFADYSEGPKPFHETPKADFLRAVDVSCFSLVALSNALRELLSPDASVVTISISTTAMAAENYGYMAPVKAALDSTVVFLAKSFSRFGAVRFNAVRAGLLKTASSAGIPGYLDSYLFAERATLRKRGVETREVADTVLFLLSPLSSGVNAQGIVVDAGMGCNFFDEEIVRRSVAGGEASA
jgi:enoyl-[acyl-carrier protein] reductase I